MYIEKIYTPSDLKKLTIRECQELAKEIRKALIVKASKKGGHLASNLGMVDATIAIHYVFNSPTDKIIFDVSHQCYTHKILTGRKDAFIDEELYNTCNGYTNPVESEHDVFRVGHTATSISLACGMAKARDLAGGKENIIAIIGDGSLSGGEALEGLNFGGSEIQGNLIIIFNDNQMSIAENHGGIYKNLQQLRETYGKCENNLFKAFGYDYLFVKDGHDIEELVKTLQSVKDIDHPIVVHICTVKGKGYEHAQMNKESTHWVRPFDIESGKEKNPFNGARYDYIIRDHLIEKMKKDERIVTMIAAVPGALSFSEEYRKQIGRQFVDVGIAEEHAIAMAAGIAKHGGKPVFATMSTFFQRTYDQISQELCINKMPATMIVVNASVYSADDVTHIGIFDIPMMSNIPNLVYLAPTNRQEYIAMLDWSIDQTEYPVAIRAPRNGVFDAKGEVDVDYSELNKYKVVSEGKEIAIIALGDFFQLGEELSDKIKKIYSINSTLINPRYITGLDKTLLTDLIKNHKLIITLEDGVLDGGFGQKIASFYGPQDMKVLNYGLKKEFLDRYNISEVMEKNHLCADIIAEDIKNYV
ncbi:1-deoxy-D-xylulose-5-phosphate synthase [Lachnospiraceae bacterium MD1]|uniref:1-deoxy-D-xylulose-5-phosphate synthase n=1 Tax=Variimorphobacter saccharofermentans TaxID=2755051 RepID=A0A839K2D5_9FIRM|nr:1-deoxy-D-xylulose-5-phosphate synthase [Variimorphobacter saccharofermentans]MBB2182851.1 1-deoxy-D-xylulose-5-phosphate synthase [Variimorphobacter saccharofermentans]